VLELQRIFDTAQTVDPNTMSLQYLETLKPFHAGPATKFAFPMEFTNLLTHFSVALRAFRHRRISFASKNASDLFLRYQIDRWPRIG
jgi:hypothetical protein